MGEHLLQHVGLVMDAEAVHEGGTGLVETEDFDLGSLAAKLEHDFVQG